tara:strand:+ start:2145 stop:2363 length:219 start_codon:yes stop_codon:yes gene_type:complete
MTLSQFRQNLIHNKKKVFFIDTNNTKHFLYSKFAVLDNNGQIDYIKQSMLFRENETKCYDYIKENKPELLKQ